MQTIVCGPVSWHDCWQVPVARFTHDNFKKWADVLKDDIAPVVFRAVSAIPGAAGQAEHAQMVAVLGHFMEFLRGGQRVFSGSQLCLTGGFRNAQV